MGRYVLVVVLSFLMHGCVSLNSLALTQIPQKRSKVVRAESSRVIVLGLNFDNDYIDGLPDKLMKQCEGGTIKGILTKDYITNYFLMLVHKRTVEARGFCDKGV